MMEHSLIGPASPLGYPAPYWFLISFKVLGFTLHAIPMSLIFAGFIFTVILRLFGDGHARHLASRISGQMPIIVALAVNLGIVPLLFLQVVYYRVFYPATILMAWPWLSIIAMLTVAYYGVYIYSVGVKKAESGTVKPIAKISGWLSAILFILIGFQFSSAYTLMTNVCGWDGIWEKTQMAGAVLGIGHDVTNPSLLPRWLMMFGLALMTTAVYFLIDTAFFAFKEREEYKRWVRGLSLKVYFVGIAWFAIMGSLYVFGTWAEEVKQVMIKGSYLPLTVITAIIGGLPFILILAGQAKMSKVYVFIIGLAQIGVLGVNAVSRQVVQNLQLKDYLEIGREPVNMQTSPLILFLILFVIGLGIIYWMVNRVVKEAYNSSV